MRKRLWFFLSSILLFLSGCIGQSNPQYSGPFAPILNIADAILIKLPANMDSNKALVHFIIWLLVFTIVYTGVDKVFNKDGKKKGTSVTISAVISLMGVFMIPTAFIKEIFRLYSNIFTWALVIAPALAGVFIAQTKFKGDNFASKGARVMVIALLLYAYTALGANAALETAGSDYTLNMGAILTYGTGILSLLLVIYVIGLLTSIGSWSKGSGSGGGGFKGAEDAVKDLSDKGKDTVRNREKIEEEMSAEEKLETDLEHIKSELEGFTASGWEDLGKLEKDVNALNAVVSKYGGQLNKNPKLKEYLSKVLKDLEKNKSVLDDILVNVSADLSKFKGELDAIFKIDAHFKDYYTYMLEDATKPRLIGEMESINIKVEDLIMKAQNSSNVLESMVAKLRTDEGNFVKIINSAFNELKESHVEAAKTELSKASELVLELKQSFEKMKELEGLEDKYLQEIKANSDKFKAKFEEAFEDAAKKA